VDTAVLAAYNNGSMRDSMTTPDPDFTGLAAAVDQYFTVEFSPADDIDEASITQAVQIRKLAAGATATDAFAATAITSTLVSFRDSIATFKMDLTGVTSTLELFIDSTKLTGRNGAMKMNSDGDEVAGETGDDDLYFYSTAAPFNADPATGLRRNPLRNISSGANFTVMNTTTGVGTFEFTCGFAALNEDYTSILTGNIVIQKYNDVTKSWDPVVSTLSKAGTTYTLTFSAVTAGITYRAFSNNVQAVKTTATYGGYIVKASYDASIRTFVNSIYTPPYPATQQITANPFDATVAADLHADATGKNRYIEFTYDVATGSTIGNLGLDLTTLLPANIKLYDDDSNTFIAISSIQAVYQDPEQKTGTKDMIRVYLDPNFGQQMTWNQSTYEFDFSDTYTDIYLLVGPGLKSLGDSAPGTVVARYFGDVTETSNVPLGFSWHQITAFDL
jgi:hypothetical protein